MAIVQDIVDRAMLITKDADGVRWTLDEMILWIRDAIDQIATLHPRVASQYRVVSLHEGTHQDLGLIDPSLRWIRLHELANNVDANQRPVGFKPRLVSDRALYFSVAKWGSRPPAAEVREFSMDERETLAFNVYPPVAEGTQVLLLASIKPPAIEDEDSDFPLPDGYEVPATDYVLYRLFSKDANDQSYAQRAAGHLQSFQLAMSVEVKDAAAQ